MLNKGYGGHLGSNVKRMAAPWAVFPWNARDALEDQSTLLGCLGQHSSSGSLLFPTAAVSRFSVKGEPGMANGGAGEDDAICFY